MNFDLRVVNCRGEFIGGSVIIVPKSSNMPPVAGVTRAGKVSLTLNMPPGMKTKTSVDACVWIDDVMCDEINVKDGMTYDIVKLVEDDEIILTAPAGWVIDTTCIVPNMTNLIRSQGYVILSSIETSDTGHNTCEYVPYIPDGQSSIVVMISIFIQKQEFERLTKENVELNPGMSYDITIVGDGEKKELAIIEITDSSVSLIGG